MGVLMIFVDGIGIGDYDRINNPFARFPSPFFATFKDRESGPIPFDGSLVATDPCMQVSGLPQSATGQTALLTGVNSAEALGRHVSGFPGPTLRNILKKHSIFLKLEKIGKQATFANAFTPEYFQRPARQISATTWSVRASGFPFRMVGHELMAGKAISHDLTNEFLSKLGYDVPIRSVQESARILCEIAESVDFCLFEFILSDMVGHSQDLAMAEEVVRRLNKLLDVVLTRLDLDKHIVLLTSDHGNFEDLSISTHTHNFVPTLVWGRDCETVAARIQRIEDVAGAILTYLTRQS